MYQRPYIHDDYVAGLEDTIVHLLLSCLLNSRTESSVYIDTHAGAGLYRMEQIKKKQRDAQKYSSLLFFKANLKNTTTASFRSRLRNLNRSSRAMRLYPGSPTLAKAFSRSGDTLVLSEQDSTIYHRLLRNTATWSNVAVLKTDGFELARRTLLSPDKERDYFIYIDPSYETSNSSVSDHDRIVRVFANLSVLPDNIVVGITYPAAGSEDLAKFQTMLTDLVHIGLPRIAYAHVLFSLKRLSLRGAGLVVVNRPQDFVPKASRALRELTKTLRLKAARTEVREVRQKRLAAENVSLYPRYPSCCQRGMGAPFTE